MRTWIVMFVVVAPLAVAQSRTDLLSNQAAKRSVDELFRAGQVHAAVAQLRTSGRAESGANGEAVALIQNLVDMSLSYHNGRQARPARDAALAAFDAADGVLKGTVAVTVKRRAELLSALGALSEHVLHDLESAKTCYSAASNLSPSAASRQRLADIEQKLRLRDKRRGR